MKHYVRLLRVKHYIKNMLIYIPLFFGKGIFDISKLGTVTAGFLSFCLISSSIYIFNDIRDVEKDRLHSTKCKRPIASGAVKINQAVITACCCIGLAILLAVFTGEIQHTWCLLLYFVLNLLYSLGLKNKPVVDVAILVSGFMIRLFYGALISGIEVSGWLYLTVMAGAFYLGLGKRRNELQKADPTKETRSVLKYYNISFLDKNMYVFLGMANVFYALWALESPNKNFIWTVPFVVLILLKYSIDVESTYDGDPVEVLLHDFVLIGLCLVYAALMIALVYFF